MIDLEHSLTSDIAPCTILQYRLFHPQLTFSPFFLYFIVFICKLYKGQAKKYYNVSLNTFHKKKRIHKKDGKKKEREGGEVKKPITL